MKKKILVTNIEWDTEDDLDEKLSPEELGLPNEVTIEDPNEEMIEEVENDDYGDAISDYLSDKYGYCIYGFTADIIEE